MIQNMNKDTQSSGMHNWAERASEGVLSPKIDLIEYV